MKRAAIIGLSASGESTLLRGIGTYSDVRADLGKHITDSRFSEVFLCEPTRRYRVLSQPTVHPVVAAIQAATPPTTPSDPKPGKFRK
jgi:hypothetical protein